jgi:hypothetical protein
LIWYTSFGKQVRLGDAVCHRTAVPLSGCPAKLEIANWLPACALPGKASLLKLNPTSPGASEIGGNKF